MERRLHGVGRAGHTTVYPQAIGLAATWDIDLIHREGQIANEGRAKLNSVHEGRGKRYPRPLLLVAEHKHFPRSALGPRPGDLWRGPYLTGHLASGSSPASRAIRSIPEARRHAEAFRRPQRAPSRSDIGFDVDPSETDLHETYLPAFEHCVRDGHVGQVMCSYNAVYGDPVPASKLLLTDILRDQWGFDGYVVSDCDAVDDVVTAIIM